MQQATLFIYIYALILFAPTSSFTFHSITPTFQLHSHTKSRSRSRTKVTTQRNSITEHNPTQIHKPLNFKGSVVTQFTLPTNEEESDLNFEVLKGLVFNLIDSLVDGNNGKLYITLTPPTLQGNEADENRERENASGGLYSDVYEYMANIYRISYDLWLTYTNALHEQEENSVGLLDVTIFPQTQSRGGGEPSLIRSVDEILLFSDVRHFIQDHHSTNEMLNEMNERRKLLGLSDVRASNFDDITSSSSSLLLSQPIQSLIPPFSLTHTNTPKKHHQNIALGGTFDHLHYGHKKLLTYALSHFTFTSDSKCGKVITVGVSDDKMVSQKLERNIDNIKNSEADKSYAEYAVNDVQSLETRMEGVRGFLNVLLKEGVGNFVCLEPNYSCDYDYGDKSAKANTNELTINILPLQTPTGVLLYPSHPSFLNITALIVSSETSDHEQIVEVNRVRGMKGMGELEVMVVEREDGVSSSCLRAIRFNRQQKLRGIDS